MNEAERYALISLIVSASDDRVLGRALFNAGLRIQRRARRQWLKCDGCPIEFMPTRKKQRYCTRNCGRRNRYARRQSGLTEP